MSPVLVSAEQCVRPIGNSVFSLSTPPQSRHTKLSPRKLSDRQNIRHKNLPVRARKSISRQKCGRNVPKVHKLLLTMIPPPPLPLKFSLNVKYRLFNDFPIPLNENSVFLLFYFSWKICLVCKTSTKITRSREMKGAYPRRSILFKTWDGGFKGSPPTESLEEVGLLGWSDQRRTFVSIA